MANRKRKIVFILLFLSLLILAFVFFSSGSGEIVDRATVPLLPEALLPCSAAVALLVSTIIRKSGRN